MELAYITCKELALGYEGSTVAHHINFEINRGDYLCVVGENGTGKSTLIKTILNLTKPISGELNVGDGLSFHEIGYLPQQTLVQKDFPASVWEIVLSGTLSKCGKKPWYGAREKELALENLKRMGIEDLKKECFRNLSGGQQQRVLLARALCAASRLLLLDEPVTGLDPKAITEFYALIRQLNKEGVSIIMVSHDLKSALLDATHILHIEREQSFYGTKEEYLKSDLGKQYVF